MGFDAHAVAAWGIKTTYGVVRATYTEEREWIGSKGGDRSFEYSPETGKPNYRMDSVPPPELDRWRMDIVDGDSYEPKSSSTCVVTFLATRTRSHRDTLSVEPVPLSPQTMKEYDDFVRDMTKLGLWSAENFGLWVYLDASY